MSRRVLLAAVLLLAAVVVGIGVLRGGASRAEAPAARPNIVLVVIDTLRADHLPFLGYPRDTAPFLSSLAARGVVFERAYSTSGWTVPATASLFTSLYPSQHGVVLSQKLKGRAGEKHEVVIRLPDAVHTFPEVLRQSGYATFGVADNAHVSQRRGYGRGFDYFVGGTNSGAAATNERVLRWRGEIGSRRPYFLYVHYNEPHMPYVSHAPWFDEYVSDGLVEEAAAPGAGDHDTAAYDSEIRWLDERIRELHDELGWDHDTVVLVTADHGEEFGDHGGRGHSSSLYGELLDVPLLVWDARGRYGPRRVGVPVSHVDMLPTLRALAGLPPDPLDQGRSLVPVLETGSGVDPDRTLFAHIRPYGRMPAIKAVIQERWKLILRDQPSERGRRELYDVAADPRETTNRKATESATLDRLAESYARFAATAPRYEGTKATFVFDKDTEEKLRALGYIQ